MPAPLQPIDNNQISHVYIETFAAFSSHTLTILRFKIIVCQQVTTPSHRPIVLLYVLLSDLMQKSTAIA